MSNDLMNSVRECCVLASVSCSSLGMTRTDKVASERVASDNHAVAGAARVVVSRLPGADEHHKEIAAAQREAVQGLKNLSMSWADEDKWRLLPNRNFNSAIGVIQGAKVKFDHAIDKLQADAPNILDRARQNMGSLSVDIPSVDELISSYSMSPDFKPLPDGAQFKGLPASVLEKLAGSLEAKVQASVEEAQTDVIRRCVPPMKDFLDRMHKYDQRVSDIAQGKDVGRHGIFRDSVITNIKELFDAMTGFNVTNDPRIAELQNMMASLANMDPDTLREAPLLRQEAVTRAQEIADNVNDWLTPQSNQA